MHYKYKLQTSTALVHDSLCESRLSSSRKIHGRLSSLFLSIEREEIKIYLVSMWTMCPDNVRVDAVTGYFS